MPTEFNMPADSSRVLAMPNQEDVIELQLSRPDSSRDFGLKLLAAADRDERGHRITIIEEGGVVQEWNAQNPGSALDLGDFIISINDKTAYPDIREMLGNQANLTLSVRMKKKQAVEKADHGIHSRCWGFAAPEIMHRINETEWIGEPETFWGPDGPKPWANAHVFMFQDSVRGLIQGMSLVFMVLNYYVSNFDSDMFAFSFGSGRRLASDGSPISSSILGILAIIGQWAFLLDVIGIIIQVITIKDGEGTYSIQYKLFAHLHRAWHKGKPPFTPIDTNSGTYQTVIFSIFILVLGLFARVPPLLLNVSREDKIIAAFPPIFWLAFYLPVQGACMGCPMRALYTARIAFGELKGPPATWNGITVLAVSYAVGGPRFQYYNDKFLKVDGIPGINEYQPKNMTPRNMAPLAIGIGGFLGMLCLWHYSPIALTISCLNIPVCLAIMIATTNVRLPSQLGKGDAHFEKEIEKLVEAAKTESKEMAV